MIFSSTKNRISTDPLDFELFFLIEVTAIFSSLIQFVVSGSLSWPTRWNWGFWLSTCSRLKIVGLLELGSVVATTQQRWTTRSFSVLFSSYVLLCLRTGTEPCRGEQKTTTLTILPNNKHRCLPPLRIVWAYEVGVWISVKKERFLSLFDIG